MSSELERIARLGVRFGTETGDAPSALDRSIVRGIGDDAAILDALFRLGADSPAAGGAKVVWTIDAQVEGVHFRSDLASWQDVGWRSFMAAASDLAAMGASPWCALSALVLPPALTDEMLDALASGQSEAARAVGAPIVGGNLARGGETSITTTLLGTCARPLQRVARAGDGIWIAGELGLAAAGLAALERKLDESDDVVARAVLAWRRPRARIDAGLAMAAVARGGIDVSDGLARDVGHMAKASGLCARILETELRAHVEPLLGTLPGRIGAREIDLALHGGEDYALVAASERPIPGFVCVGRFENRRAEELLVLQDERGGASLLEPRGFDHFR